MRDSTISNNPGNSFGSPQDCHRLSAEKPSQPVIRFRGWAMMGTLLFALFLGGVDDAAPASVDVRGTTWVTTGKLKFKVKKVGTSKGIAQATVSFFSDGNFNFAVEGFGDAGTMFDILSFRGTYEVDPNNTVQMFPDETSLAGGLAVLIDENAGIDNRRGDIELKKVRIKAKAKERKDVATLTVRLKLRFSFFVEVEEDFVFEFPSVFSFRGNGPRA